MRDLIRRLLQKVGHALQPLFRPDEAERVHTASATNKRLKSVQADLARAVNQIQKVKRKVDASDRRQMGRIDAAVKLLHHDVSRQRALVNRLTRSSRQHQQRERVRDRAMHRLRLLAQRPGPILVGPWTGEVGFELLSWVPFVRWALGHFRIDPSRVTILSRGGSQSWYGLHEARYVDVFELSTPELFREHTVGAQKQRTLRRFDRDLILRASRAADTRMGVLHPAMMYSLYQPYWSEEAPSRWVHQLAEHHRITPPTIEGLTLPRGCRAARFYFSKCFPDTPANRALVESLLVSIASETDVVLLTPPIQVDNHRDLAVDGARIHTVDHLVRPENNLAVQTAVVAGARAFVGTYGGFSYLAPLCGVDTVAFYSRRTYFPYHLDFAQHVFEQVGGGTLTVADVSSWPLLRQLSVDTSAAEPVQR